MGLEGASCLRQVTDPPRDDIRGQGIVVECIDPRPEHEADITDDWHVGDPVASDLVRVDVHLDVRRAPGKELLLSRLEVLVS